MQVEKTHVLQIFTMQPNPKTHSRGPQQVTNAYWSMSTHQWCGR